MKDCVLAAKPVIKKACYLFRIYETKAFTEFNAALRKEAFKNPVGTKDDQRKKEIRFVTHREMFKTMNDRTNDPTNDTHYPLEMYILNIIDVFAFTPKMKSDSELDDHDCDYGTEYETEDEYDTEDDDEEPSPKRVCVEIQPTVSNLYGFYTGADINIASTSTQPSVSNPYGFYTGHSNIEQQNSPTEQPVGSYDANNNIISHAESNYIAGYIYKEFKYSIYIQYVTLIHYLQ